MIRFSVYYPTTEGASFDHDYYRDTHVPLLTRLWNPATVEIDQGLHGPNLVVLHCTFDSMEALGASMASGTEEILADVANFTTIQSAVQISEIVQ